MKFERWLLSPVAPDVPLDPLAVYVAAGAQCARRAYWSTPDDDVELAAIGAAAVLRPPPRANNAERFRAVDELLGELNASVSGVDAAAPAEVIALGGFDFAGEPEGEPAGALDERTLAPGGPASDHLVVPELLVVRRGQEAVAVGVAASRHQHEALLAAAVSRQRAGAATATKDVLAATEPRAIQPASARPHPNTTISSASDDAYLRLVAGALDAIDDGVLTKVVTARSYPHTTSSSPEQLLARLRSESAAGALSQRERVRRPSLFCFTSGAQSFIGASPEVLARFDGARVTTSALAGSRPRTGEAARDDELRRELLTSAKERAEHNLVVSAITASLASAGVSVDSVASTEVMALARIQHLHTPISGTVPQRAGTQPTSVLDLVAALHPTPAVGGQPIAAALEWIDANEHISRGWFCGPLGWTTTDGIGEFRVGLRCARMTRRADGDFDMTLFAGGGIVAGAEPATELAETATKLETLLAVAPEPHTKPAAP